MCGVDRIAAVVPGDVGRPLPHDALFSGVPTRICAFFRRAELWLLEGSEGGVAKRCSGGIDLFSRPLFSGTLRRRQDHSPYGMNSKNDPIAREFLTEPNQLPPMEKPPTPRESVRLVVVDDNEDAADTLANLFTLFGYDVRTVYTGEDALALVDAFKPHALLLDIGLPGISGYDVARRIRSCIDPAIAGCKLIALSGWGAPHDRLRAAEAGFDAHRTKPTDGLLLNHLLVELLKSDAE